MFVPVTIQVGPPRHNRSCGRAGYVPAGEPHCRRKAFSWCLERAINWQDLNRRGEGGIPARDHYENSQDFAVPGGPGGGRCGRRRGARGLAFRPRPARLQAARRLPAADRHAGLRRRRPPAGRIRHREARLRAGERHAAAGHPGLRRGRGPEFLHPSRRRSAGVVRAALADISRYRHASRRPEGASTITQQVAKNFLLTNEVSFARKVREAIIAFRIEQALSKERILELYLNEIYLGGGAYGVAAAALNYFDGRSASSGRRGGLSRGLAQGAQQLQSRAQSRGGAERRDYVLGRMVEAATSRGAGRGGEGEADRAAPARRHRDRHAPTSSPRRCAANCSRPTATRRSTRAGSSVRTSLDPGSRRFRHALRDGLIAYDRRHGWRGP